MKNILGAIWQNSNVARSQGDYITQISDEIEGRVTKKLSQDFSRTENRKLDALSRLNDFFMNPLVQGHFGTAPETSWNTYNTNQETNEDESQSDLHPEASIFHNQTTRNSGPEFGHNNRCRTWLRNRETIKILQLNRWPVEFVPQKLSGCRSIPAKPTCIKKEKDIPRLPEI